MRFDTPSDTSVLVLLMRVSGQTLAMRQREVAEILPVPRLAALPEAPPMVRGAFHLAGDLVLVLPMAPLLGLSQPAEENPLYHHLLLLPERPGALGRGGLRLALMVDRATDVQRAEATLLPPGESFNDCIDGDIRLDGALVPLVTAGRLLTAHARARLAAFAERAAIHDAGFAPPAPVTASA
jgi:chemotaxis signal transduction protein